MFSKLSQKLYWYFAEKNAHVQQEYEPYVKSHPHKYEGKPWKRWCLLIRLNWWHRVCGHSRPLVLRGVALPSSCVRLPYLDGAESTISRRVPLIYFVKDLLKYDIVSFDIFDTLILRPFSQPDDLFMIVGKRLGIPEFHRIRRDAEIAAREIAAITKGVREVTISDIYAIIEERTGLSQKKGIDVEFSVELEYCFANPYMKNVFKLLQEYNKKIIITSDMYLPHDMMTVLLKKNGYQNYHKLFVSCDYDCSKRSTGLYELILNEFTGKKIVHIGDNAITDIKIPREMGIQCRWYKNVHEIGNPYRADGMSALIGSAYAGTINTYLHNGVNEYSPHYEYGFIYGGLYVLGFCHWLYKKAKNENVDKIIFLSRDGSIYQKVFNTLFKDMPNEYFLWSRIANAKYTLIKNREDFLKRMIKHHSTDIVPITIGALLDSLSLHEMKSILPRYDLSTEDTIIPENTKRFDNFFIKEWHTVCNILEKEKKFIMHYIAEKIADSSKVAIVDVGWRASGPLGLKYLIEDELKLKCKVSCWEAASRGDTPTDHVADLMDDTVEPYIFSVMHNRSLFDSHTQTNKNLNSIFFELFTQDTTPSYSGINRDGNFQYDIPEVENYHIIKSIHEGIFDFCRIFYEKFKNDKFLFNISGYDAYCPFRFIIKRLSFISNYLSELRYARGLSGDVKNQHITTIREILKAAEL